MDDPGRGAGEPQPSHDAGRTEWETAVRKVQRREHALVTLRELSQSLSATTDLYEQIDTLLFGAMGQLGTSKAALWVLTPDLGTMPVLLRCHGFRKSLQQGFGSVVTPALLGRLAKGRQVAAAEEMLEEPEQRFLTQQAGVAVVAVIHSAQMPLGVVTIGRPLDRERYDAGDLQLLETAVGLIGMAITNARLLGDLTESNRELRRTNQEMEALDRMKSNFLANVNHELRTPLSVIRASLELLRDQVEGLSTGIQTVDLAMGSTRRLQELVENLLRFSALEQDLEPRTVEPTDVVELLHEYHHERMPGITAGFREISLALPESLPPAQADAEGLRAILDQVVNNAVKFAPRGTRIDLSARWESAGESGHVAIRIADDGPGLPPERLASIFRVFENGGASQPSRAGGIGLGLPLATRLARSMGGTLDIESRLGEGTCVTIRLRAVDRRRATAGEERREAA